MMETWPGRRRVVRRARDRRCVAIVAAGCSASRAIAPPTTLGPHALTTSTTPSTTTQRRPPRRSHGSRRRAPRPSASAERRRRPPPSSPPAATITPSATTTAAAPPRRSPGIAPTSTLARADAGRVGRGRRLPPVTLTDSGDYAFSVAVSIDGVPVHAAAFGTRNSPDIVLPPPGRRLRRRRHSRRDDHHHDHGAGAANRSRPTTASGSPASPR